MKRLISAAACALLLLGMQAELDAQTIGFKVGPTWANMDVDPDEDTEQSTLTSFGGGGFIRFGFAGLSAQLELLAVTKGSKVDAAGDDDVKLKMDYIEVPFTAMFSFGTGPYVFLGPVASFEIGCKAEVEFEGDTFKADCDDDEGPTEGDFERKKFLFGATAGAGFQFPVGPGSVLLEGRHTWNFTNLNDVPNSDTKIRHRQIAVFAGYAIPIGGR